MGNDAKAGTVVWGHRIGELNGTSAVLEGNRTFSGLKPNAHYVVVIYAPYLGYGSLNPFHLRCFRTAKDPNTPFPNGGYGTGCFANGIVGYAQCVQDRQNCTDGGGNWNNSNLSCTN